MPPGQEKPASLTRPAEAVPAGAALRRIRLELGLLAVFGPVAWLVADKLLTGALHQVLAMAGYGILAMIWLLVRIRRLLARHT